MKFAITGLRTFQITQDGAQIGVDFTVKNIGRSPANKVWVNFKFFPMVQDKYPYSEQKTLCDKMRSQEQPDPMMSRTLFPDEQFEMSVTIRMSKAEIEDALKNRPIDQPKIIAPYVVGCVDYRSGSGILHHQTPFVFEIKRTGPPYYIQMDKGDIDATELLVDNYLQMVDTPPD